MMPEHMAIAGYVISVIVPSRSALISSTLVMSESGEPVISKNKAHRKDKRMRCIF